MLASSREPVPASASGGEGASHAIDVPPRTMDTSITCQARTSLLYVSFTVDPSAEPSFDTDANSDQGFGPPGE